MLSANLLKQNGLLLGRDMIGRIFKPVSTKLSDKLSLLEKKMQNL